VALASIVAIRGLAIVVAFTKEFLKLCRIAFGITLMRL
jgi:hypothetical protein